MTHFKHIVVPVDFEDNSREALEVATDLALTFDAQLTLVHVWEVPIYPYAGMPYLPVDLWSVVEQAAKEQLAKTLEQVRKRLPRADSVLARGVPAVEVLAAAGRANADLIIMGTHGRRGLSRALLGSVAEKLVRTSTVPVLTIRGKAQPS